MWLVYGLFPVVDGPLCQATGLLCPTGLPADLTGPGAGRAGGLQPPRIPTLPSEPRTHSASLLLLPFRPVQTPGLSSPFSLTWTGAWCGRAELLGQKPDTNAEVQLWADPMWPRQKQVSCKHLDELKMKRRKLIKMTVIKCTLWNGPPLH